MEPSKRTPQLDRACEILCSIKQKRLQLSERVSLAIELAAVMIRAANQMQTKKERRTQCQLSKMMEDVNGKAFATSMTDQCFRSENPYRVADQLIYLLKKHGIPQFVSWTTKLQLRTFAYVGKLFAPLFVPLVKMVLYTETAGVIIPGESEKLIKHIQKRHREGTRINLNHLGEAILGENEANKRLEIYLADLARPEIECISVKISTLYSQLNLLAWDDTLDKLAEKMRKLYREGMKHPFYSLDGEVRSKLINLDMEEYRDVHLTVALFKKVLEEPEFHVCFAGIVLQAYLPDSFAIQKELTDWAQKRVANGGSPIRIRLVKGANLAMEQVQASFEGWTQAPFSTKIEVDANYKKMMHFGFKTENAACVNLGIASHNLFDIAYALILRSENDVEACITFEMLEGMVDHQRKVVQTIAKSMLLYCPTAKKEEFVSAVAYLIRRLDENTAPENYLRHLFDLTPGSPSWQQQAKLFEKACEGMDSVGSEPRRRQDRRAPLVQSSLFENLTPFENEANSDWSLPHNRLWIGDVVRQWENKGELKVPLMIGNEAVWNEEHQAVGCDPSRPGYVLYRYCFATEEQAERALSIASSYANQWDKVDRKMRSQILAEAAKKLRLHRGDLIACMIGDGGKIIEEADGEVSEAIDFCEYYRRSVDELYAQEDMQWTPKGVVLVTPPWNFPCAIPAGGIFAALATGNTVILKPAEEGIFVAWHLAKLCWDAGIPKEALQFIICEEDDVGSKLIRDTRIDCVLLTGATATAKHFCRLRPGLDLQAETGGKNAIIVTNLSDRDLAIKEVIHSAFSHSGQKCSACSLLILEAEVYDSAQFRRQLRDAAASLKVGSAWDASTKINPLIHPPGKELLRGLTELEEGEEWLLRPLPDRHNPRLWSPGIKWGVKPGSFMHQTELFGPLLGVMRAKNLPEAIEIANSTPYGLTSGLQSLDDREQEYWLQYIEAGNCYINRGITGAIVQRQPFGGCKASSYGGGAKAGGPHYLLQLLHAKGRAMVVDMAVEDGWKNALSHYAHYWQKYFKNHSFKLLGQDNFLRYVPAKGLIFRLQDGDAIEAVLSVLAAAVACGCKLQISAGGAQCEELAKVLFKHQVSSIPMYSEGEREFMERLKRCTDAKVRMLAKPSQQLLDFLGKHAIYHICGPALVNGRIELHHYLREVSVSRNTHRYGNLGIT